MRITGLAYLASCLLATATASSALDFDYTERFMKIGHHTYHYLRTEPAEGTTYAGTVLLIHGFPDLPFGWHKQIPFFSNLGYRVIAPSTIGYFPTSVPDDLEAYSVANMANELAELIKGVVSCGEQVILGGHDWGMFLGWALTYRHPDLIKAVIGLSVPHFGPPAPKYVDLADQIAANQSLSLAYQLQLRDPKFPDNISGPLGVRQALRSIFDGRTAQGKPTVSAFTGLDLGTLNDTLPAPNLPQELEDIFVERLTIADNTIRGPLKHYRTSEINWRDSTEWQKAGGSYFINQSTLFFCGLRDQFVPCELSKFMVPLFADLTLVKVNSTHWIQQAAEEINPQIESFLAGLE